MRAPCPVLFRRRSKAVRWSLLVSLAATTGLAACAAGPDAKTPASPFHGGYNSADLLATRSTTGEAVALDHWWTGFHDATLDALVQEAGPTPLRRISASPCFLPLARR